MATSSTTLKKGDNLPGRGRAIKTLMLEAIREESLLSLTPKSTREDAEKAYLKHIAKRAFNPEDPASPTLIKTLMDKSYPSIKATMPTYDFEFDVNAKPMEQASQIIKASSTGQIPPDVASVFVQSIKNMIDIEEYTDLKERIEKLEAIINGDVVSEKA